uniref:Uncharacterized protein n=1 Tax=Anguilla anguilla TaxID=7936 RepID=A0A0E9R4K2_ANGAN
MLPSLSSQLYPWVVYIL